TIAIFTAYFLLSYVGMRRSDVTWTAFVAAHGPGAALAALVIAACWPIAHALRGADVHYVAIAAIVSVAAAVVGMIGVALGLRGENADLVWLRDVVVKAIRRR